MYPAFAAPTSALYAGDPGVSEPAAAAAARAAACAAAMFAGTAPAGVESVAVAVTRGARAPGA